MANATSTPKTKKPPGGRMAIIIGSIKAEVTGSPKIVPAPIISRMAPIRTRVAVKPMPMPSASRMEGSRVFLLANISARARIMQLTTIRGR